MSEFEVLEVRFHFNGDFVLDGLKMLYCNGDCGVSHIEDKISILELEGHLLDHTTFPRSVRMHWLPYGAELNSGMRDANNQIYPIAWAVVEYENKDSWNWFFGHL